jgi:cation:H+ antiporter
VLRGALVCEGMLIVWLEFAACVGLIWAGGVRLSRSGDVIAEKTGLSRAWIGLIMLATVTSLPELVTGISAVTIAGAPNIALGDVLGSCVFNLSIITILDFLQRGESVFTRASQGHILSAGFGVILIGFVAFTLLASGHGPVPSVGHVGLSSLIMIVLYAIAVRTVFRYERRQVAAYAEGAAERYPRVTLRQAIVRYLMAAFVVVATGSFLPFVGNQMAVVMGWQQTFVGTLFVAFATSAPEIVVTVAALRMDALDMAIGNLFGSNLFDVVLVAVDDIFFLPGPILAHVSPLHAVTCLSAVMMTGVAIVGLLYRPRRRLFRTVGWAGLLLFSLYLLNTYVLYLYGE